MIKPQDGEWSSRGKRLPRQIDCRIESERVVFPQLARGAKQPSWSHSTTRRICHAVFTIGIRNWKMGGAIVLAFVIGACGWIMVQLLVAWL
jgi:hypothetical protein